MTSKPPTCPCGNPVALTGTTKDDISDWRCCCGRFGFLLPPDYLTKHPEELPVQVCGRKQTRTTKVAA
ncbi:hypothetical protein ACFC26_29850 [Kitasatospora purpeofusca]|uniref:hypothetical protein n=1 Tax=Kitasatospora purpeofusca TaxID=67352 RepID=UPI0035D8ABE4